MEKQIKIIKIIKFMGRTDFDTLDSVVQDHLVKEVNYNTSWDDLMPVVDKIEGLNGIVDGRSWSAKPYSVKIEAYGVQIEVDRGLTPTPFTEFSSNDKLLNIYNAVLEFIDFYNENNL